MPANNLDEVIAKLESIVEESLIQDDGVGMFAQLYLRVTRKVKDAIADGQFQDGERMERLDVIFANRYLEAYENYQLGNAVTQAWESAFLGVQNNRLLIVQHLFMGMNAHINLDLGIAASEVVPAQELSSLRHDFDIINSILANDIEAVQAKLNKLSPLLFLLDWVGKKSDEHLMRFSIKQARAQAWRVAGLLSKTAIEVEKQEQIKELDSYVALLNKFITEPGVFGNCLVKLIKWFEEKNNRAIIRQIG